MPDNTQLDARIRGYRFIITTIGPAHFVAECAEQLAWIQAALLSYNRNPAGYCAPSIQNYAVKTIHLPSKQLKYEGDCGVSIDFTPLVNPADAIPQKHSWRKSLVSKRTIIPGFPISRRPEAYPGLELSFKLLLSSVQTDEAIIDDGLVLLIGPMLRLQLFKDTNGIFLWRPFHLRNGICSCGEQHMEISLNTSYSFTDLRRLETGRHIVSACTDLLTSIAEGECSNCLFFGIFSDNTLT